MVAVPSKQFTMQMGIKLTGELQPGIYAQDIMLALIARYGVTFGVGYAVEFYGPLKSLRWKNACPFVIWSLKVGENVDDCTG